MAGVPVTAGQTRWVIGRRQILRRLFAIFGIAKQINDFRPESPFMVWGMDFGDERGAVAWDPDDKSSHCANNAGRVLCFCQRLGEARLVWLDAEDGECAPPWAIRVNLVGCPAESPISPAGCP